MKRWKSDWHAAGKAGFPHSAAHFKAWARDAAVDTADAWSRVLWTAIAGITNRREIIWRADDADAAAVTTATALATNVPIVQAI